VLRTIAAEGLLDHVKRVGEQLRRGIEALRHPLVAGVRGAGLLLGIVLTAPASAAVTGALRDAGFLTNPCQPDLVRLAPPLILTAEQADAFLAALPAALEERSPAVASERQAQ
jgi:acetylornithine aminotransferase